MPMTFNAILYARWEFENESLAWAFAKAILGVPEMKEVATNE